MASKERKMTFALAGNPNCGKTTLFNGLTGSTAHVGNWPGVTVEKRSGTYKKGKNGPLEIIDLPGIYSLSPYTSEEVISRNYILDEHPDCVINVVDATNFERNLYLTTQLMEMDVPLIVALNMSDVLEKQGEKIDLKTLEDRLGVPVVLVSALKGKGLGELMEKAYETTLSSRKGRSVLHRNESLSLAVSKAESLYAEAGIGNALFHAIKALEADELEEKENASLYKEVRTSIGEGLDFEAEAADTRYRVITEEYAPCLTKHVEQGNDVEVGKPRLTISDKIDKVLTNKWLGIPIFIAILLVIFHLVFSEDFLFLGASGALGDISMPDYDGSFAGFFIADGALMSPGVILMNLVNGVTDWFTGLVSGGLESVLPDGWEWVNSLLCDGIFGGIFAVIGFLPQILLLFLFFSILEDSGYMARVAFILDRIFRKFGLSGRAFMPMIMGFGCSIPAMMNTRTLSTDNEKVQTIRVIPFFSCGAKLPILTGVAGGLCLYLGLPYTDLIVASMYVLGMAVAIIAVLVMHHTSRREKVPPFIMELPAYHTPQFKALMLHLWDKCKHFVKKAFTIIFATTVLIWLLTHLSWNWTYLPDEASSQSILASLGSFIQPLFTPLGFGVQLTSVGWVFAVAAITGLLAKENAVGTLGSLAVTIGVLTAFGEDGDAGEMMSLMIGATGISAGGAIAFIVFNLLTIPCFAAVSTARSELPSKKDFWWTMLFWLAVSYFVSTAFYLMIDWPWTIAIVVPVVIAGGVGVYFYSRKMNRLEGGASL